MRELFNIWKWRIHCIINDIHRWWYKTFYGVDVSLNGTMFAKFGKGKFVSVKKNGPYWEITAHRNYPGIERGMIRLIPYQPNHGIMIEFTDANGKIRTRSHCDYRQLFLLATEGNHENR